MYLRCDGTFSVDSSGAPLCSDWISLTSEQLLADLPATSLDILVNSQLVQADYLIIISAIALFYATCWGFNILGRQINPR
jgi:hypothetical protein